MKRGPLVFILVLISLFILTVSALLDIAYALEKAYQIPWCKKYNGEVEYTLTDRTRVDCLLDDYAIEFDFAHKWAESIGQSLLYASRTAARPGIVLIMESKKDCKYLDRLHEAVYFGGLGITIWQTGAYSYRCSP